MRWDLGAPELCSNHVRCVPGKVPPHSGDAQSLHTARVTSGGDGRPTMDEIEEKKRIAEEEEEEKDRITPVSRSWTEGMLLVHRLKR